jgi:hypothetical protein
MYVCDNWYVLYVLDVQHIPIVIYTHLYLLMKATSRPVTRRGVVTQTEDK